MIWLKKEKVTLIERNMFCQDLKMRKGSQTALRPKRKDLNRIII